MATEFLDFSGIANPLGTPVSFAAALEDPALSQTPSCTIESIVERDYGLAAGSVLVGGAAADLLVHVMRAFRPCTVALPAPIRCEHAASARAAGHSLARLSSPTGFVVPDPSYAGRCGDVFDAAILANPSYPTSRLLSKPTLLSYLDVCEWVVVDERSIELSMGGETMAPLSKERRNLLVLQSLDESFALEKTPVSFVVAHPQTIARIRLACGDATKPPYADALGQAACDERAHLDVARECLETEIPWMQCMLNLVPGVHIFPAEANYVLCLFDAGPDLRLGVSCAEELVERLGAAGFAVHRFVDTPPLDARFFCVAIRTRDENARLVSALRAVVGGC